MKHKLTITLTLLIMFLITQFIGLFVINTYNVHGLPTYFDSSTETSIINFIPSFIFAVLIILLLMKYKQRLVMKIWFMLVIITALFLAINAVFIKLNLNFWIIPFLIAISVTLLKIIKPIKYIHNLTEILIYPGISAIFIPLFGIRSIILILILISLYDIWAVWHSGIMQKMAKFQMEEVGIFGGFLIPSLTKKQKELIKSAKKSKETHKLEKIKFGIAILGGGDIVFPIITAGVFMTAFSSIIPALFIIFGAFCGLAYLFMITEEHKAYPAMPFITFGIFAGLTLWRIFFF